MTTWTSIEQIGAMAAEVMVEGKEESDVIITIRRAARTTADAIRWTATIGSYSSKAARTPEAALEEVSLMYRSALLARIERSEERIRKARAALPSDPETPCVLCGTPTKRPPTCIECDASGRTAREAPQHKSENESEKR